MRWPGREWIPLWNELWSPFTWFRDRISHWNESFDPERESVRARSGMTLVSFQGHVDTVRSNAELQDGKWRNRSELAHSGLKLDPLSCKQPLSITLLSRLKSRFLIGYATRGLLVIVFEWLACATDETFVVKVRLRISAAFSVLHHAPWINYVYSNLIGFSRHLFELNVLN